MQSRHLALLGMELRADHVLAPDDCGDPAAILGVGKNVAFILAGEAEGMDEIGVTSAGKSGEHGMAGARLELVPAHMRHLERGVRRRNGHDLALEPAEPFGDLELAPALGHELHPDADAEERPAAPL